MLRAIRLLKVALAAVVGAVLSYVPAVLYSVHQYIDSRTTVLPFPHHIPNMPGGVSLRFAMVQDVLHERFARHGRAYYTERNRRAREDLARLELGDRSFALMDDLGVGLDHLGE